MPEDDKNQTGSRNESRGKQIHEPELYRCPKHPVNGVSGDLPLVFAGWMVFTFLPLMIALALDGYYQWKNEEICFFGDVTIQLYRLWFRSLSIIGVLIIAYLVIPNMNLFLWTDTVFFRHLPRRCSLLQLTGFSRTTKKTHVRKNMFKKRPSKPETGSVQDVVSRESKKFLPFV
uniref:TraJ n=1 Tax=Klebsiella pneumoniae TaxID=573 RepID=A0A8B0SVC9_KLEPN|nr:TraJ [Klebsiella pneumoniae]